MFTTRIRRLLQLNQFVTGLVSLLGGMIIAVLSNWLSDTWVRYLPWVVGAFAIAGIAWAIIMIRKPLDIDVFIRAPRTASDKVEAAQYARRGFVGYVPIFTQQCRPDQKLSASELSEAIDRLDFNRLCILDSNLAPTIKALISHKSRLEHCWLLSTRGKNNKGSLAVARLLAEYLRQREGFTCQFHCGEEYSLTMDRDTQVLANSYTLVRKVFLEAEKLRIPHNEIVANITTGVRSMTLGMVLACLDGDRDIEFVGAEYDQDSGQPLKPEKDEQGVVIDDHLIPITFSFEPKIES